MSIRGIVLSCFWTLLLCFLSSVDAFIVEKSVINE